MQTTRQNVADRLGDYLAHQLPLEDLVDWAELQMMEGEFESSVVRDAVARLGVADVRAFGLTWEDCQQLLGSVGYAANVQIVTT